jgi:tripeptide aminopeptidase
VNVGLLSGGQSINSIAAAAELVVEMRALEEPPLAEFDAALDALPVAPPLVATTERVGRRPAGRLDRSHPLLARVRRVRAALARGIPALAVGVAYGGGMHRAAEWIDVDSLELGLRGLEAVVADLLEPA